jgi:hypothetical protein
MVVVPKPIKAVLGPPTQGLHPGSPKCALQDQLECFQAAEDYHLACHRRWQGIRDLRKEHSGKIDADWHALAWSLSDDQIQEQIDLHAKHQIASHNGAAAIAKWLQDREGQT